MDERWGDFKSRKVKKTTYFLNGHEKKKHDQLGFSDERRENYMTLNVYT